nr:unnamed protein product [Callosobruchus analis]
MDDVSYFNFASVVEPNVIALKLLGFWRSPISGTIFSTVWYKAYTILMVFLPISLSISGFWYLYDKRQNLTVEDVSSVVFIYPTALINIMMMMVIYVHIDMIHFIQSEMQAERFQPKTTAQAADAKKWKRIARLFQKVFFVNNTLTVPIQALLGLLKGDRLLLVAHVFPGLNWKIFYIYQVSRED